ncbi:CRISPR-associated endonuclease Cas6 [Methanobrevibacter curvatus]|nr:CRISPR-associated endonuclease Cas6 [Methanobrevibacter curvatus]
MKINTAHLTLKTDKKVTEEVSKLRGYIGNKFKDYPLLHNHFSENKFLYSYPLIQYKIVDGEVSILAIEEGISTIKEIYSDIEELKLKNTYEVREKILREKTTDIRTTNEEIHYKFLSPWVALNPNNHSKFQNLKMWKDKKLFLNSILIGNILSMSKGLGIIVNRKIYPKTHLDECEVIFKGLNMIGFTGEFKIRYKIPDFFGLGKGVSQGFGTIKEITDNEI